MRRAVDADDVAVVQEPLCDTHGVETPRELRTPDELREQCLSGGGPYACPCCRFLTLEARGNYEICNECGWEDDGQDDLNADEVWGGPNGSESLTDARNSYALYASEARASDADSIVNGGEGAWWAPGARRMRDRGCTT